jgi:hypothetical protein
MSNDESTQVETIIDLETLPVSGGLFGYDPKKIEMCHKQIMGDRTTIPLHQEYMRTLVRKQKRDAQRAARKLTRKHRK